MPHHFSLAETIDLKGLMKKTDLMPKKILDLLGSEYVLQTNYDCSDDQYHFIIKERNGSKCVRTSVPVEQAIEAKYDVLLAAVEEGIHIIKENRKEETDI